MACKKLILLGEKGSMHKSSYKAPKRNGRWNTSNRENLGKIYGCPNCHNQNKEPLINSEGKPYCSSCLVKFGEVFILKGRTMYSYSQKRKK